MIRFVCHQCQKRCKAPAEARGKRAKCPRCGVALVVPTSQLAAAVDPIFETYTDADELQIIGPFDAEPTANDISNPTTVLACPRCKSKFTIRSSDAGKTIKCPTCTQWLRAPEFPTKLSSVPPSANQQCGIRPPPLPQANSPTTSPFAFDPLASDRASPPLRQHAESENLDSSDDNTVDTESNHSGLGIASFLIALVVGGLDIILAVAIAAGIAGSGPRQPNPFQPNLHQNMLAGGVAFFCFNCMSLPLCLTGAGLGFVALVVHRNRDHVFTWIGLLGNGVVILGVVGFYLFSIALSSR